MNHLDEVGSGVAGRTRWLYVPCSTALSHLRLGASLGDVPGKVVHDCNFPNWTVEDVTHGVYNAHTLRELQALIEHEKEAWKSDMKTILHDALNLTHIAQGQGRGAVNPEEIKDIERRFDFCCDQAVTSHVNQLPLTHLSKRKKRGRLKRRIGHDLALQFSAHKAAYLLFLIDLDVPFTNNEAECGLRKRKVRRKISGYFRTATGAENFCILRTFNETARKQGLDILQTLKTAPDQLILMLNVGRAE